MCVRIEPPSSSDSIISLKLEYTRITVKTVSIFMSDTNLIVKPSSILEAYSHVTIILIYYILKLMSVLFKKH